MQAKGDHMADQMGWQQRKSKRTSTPYWRLRGLLVAFVLVGCIPLETVQPSAGAPQPTHSPTGSPEISVAGTYTTVVTLAENSCGAVTVASLPTAVEQQPGELDFVLTHAGNRFNGTLQPDAAFTTDPLILHSGRDTYTVTVRGSFAPTGFAAQTKVEVQQVQAPQSCDYTVHWVGTKQGPPNDLP